MVALVLMPMMALAATWYVNGASGLDSNSGTSESAPKATIQAAIQAYNSANGPYTVLHDGTAPDGWKIDETTKALIKVAKGFFFMAY